jgi:hypothetical protein
MKIVAIDVDAGQTICECCADRGFAAAGNAYDDEPSRLHRFRVTL